MTMLEAARMGDKVAHSNALLGFLTGMVVGAVFAVGVALLLGATIATGGGALVLAGALLAGAGGGALAGMSVGADHKKGRGDPIQSGAARTFIGRDKHRAARATVDFVSCHDPKLIADGSLTVQIENAPAARRTDQTECGGTIDEGWPTVFIGKEAGRYLAVESEVPEWMVTAAVWAVRIGTVLGLVGGVIVAGVVVTAAAFFGGMAGGWAGGKVGGWIGSFWGETGRKIGEYFGGEIGGLVGGHYGSKGAVGASRQVFRANPELAARVARSPGETPTKIAAREVVARNHYEKTRPWDPARQTRDAYRKDINSHMAGIDFRKPVYVEPLDARTTLYTYNKPGAQNAGSYFTRGPERPTDIGISEKVTYERVDPVTGAKTEVTEFKDVYRVELKQDVEALVSTASPKLDNFSQYGRDAAGNKVYRVAESKGGAEQLNINTMYDVNHPRSQPNTFEVDAAGNRMRPTGDSARNYVDPTTNQSSPRTPPKEYENAPVVGDTPYRDRTTAGNALGVLGGDVQTPGADDDGSSP